MTWLFRLISVLVIQNLILMPTTRAEISDSSAASIQAQVFNDLGISEEDEVPVFAPDDQETLSLENEQTATKPEVTISATEVANGVSRLQIIGKGIKNRQTGDSIALGCVNSECTEIRAVYFTANTREATYFGKSYFISKKGAVTDRKEMKMKVKEINQAYRIYKRQNPTVQARKAKGLLIGGLCIMFCTFIGPLMITKGAIATAAFGISIWAGSLAFVGIAYLLIAKKPLFSKSGMVSEVFVDQNGWNWEDQPRTVSPFTFQLFNSFASQTQ